MTTKTDQRAAERLLKRAVEVAVADLRRPGQAYEALRRRNEDRFHVAIRAAALFVTDDAQPASS